jgi:uncharacterized protein (UPF0254 family)
VEQREEERGEERWGRGIREACSAGSGKTYVAGVGETFGTERGEVCCLDDTIEEVQRGELYYERRARRIKGAERTSSKSSSH